MANDLGTPFTTSRGDPAGLIEVLSFLGRSADHSIKRVPLDAIPSGAAEALRQATRQDGYDADVEFKDGVVLVHMVSGRVERDIVLATLHTDTLGQSWIEYVADGFTLLGRRYRNSPPGIVFLNYEIFAEPDEPVFVTGNTEYLGAWNIEKMLRLEGGQRRGGFSWRISIPLAPGQTIEFKFIKKALKWEGGQNRLFTAGDHDETKSDSFRS